jgi:D-3-phosphoglycerate dehydrogenase
VDERKRVPLSELLLCSPRRDGKSYPFSEEEIMPKVLVSDKLAAEGIEILRRVAEVDVNTGLSEDQLCEIIGNYEALVVRSGTQVTAKVLQAAKKLQIVGRAGVGVDNVDVPVATEKGVIVVNIEPCPQVDDVALHQRLECDSPI